MTQADDIPPPSPPANGKRGRLPKWVNVWNLIFVVVLVWAMPRCWPHVRALAGVAESEHRQPHFTVATRDGRLLTHDSVRGRVVLVNIWATWCPPCRAEMPALQQLANAYADDGVIVLGLSVDRGPAAGVDRFLTERSITYPVAIINDATLAAFGSIRGYPTSILIDRTGIIRHTVLGPIAPLTLRPAILRLVNESR